MDRRERILTRVFDLLKTIEGFHYAHNRGELPEDQRPALVLLDGDEQISLAQLTMGRGQLRTPPTIMELRPQIFLVLQSAEPKNEGITEQLNSARRLVLPKLLPMVVGDATLLQLVGSNGFIRYEGLATDMASGRSMRGELQFMFAFGYVLRLDELATGA